MRDKYKLAAAICDWLSAFCSGNNIHRCKVALPRRLRAGAGGTAVTRPTRII